jgi:hypothetical protein
MAKTPAAQRKPAPHAAEISQQGLGRLKTLRDHAKRGISERIFMILKDLVPQRVLNRSRS